MSTDAKSAILAFLESLGANEGYGEELYRIFQANPAAVPPAWRSQFEQALDGSAPARANGAAAPSPAPAPAGFAGGIPVILPQEGDEIAALQGAALRLATNMQASVSVPTATSQRSVPVRLLEENRRLINQALAPRGLKLPVTPLLAWALVRAVELFPSLNSAFTLADAKPARIRRAHVHLGLAVDVERAGARTLLVPVVRRAGSLDFAAFNRECERLIAAARANKLNPDELVGATISLTNPGTLGTRASVPRLMAGQSAIVAAGAAAWPPGFEGVPEATLQVLGVGKSMTLSCTYDHRLVQGAESGAFLARMQSLLLGEDGFYQSIFDSLEIATPPAQWAAAPSTAFGVVAGAPDFEPVRKQAAIFQLVRAYRVRGHLMAAIDPLGLQQPRPHPELDPAHYGLSIWDYDRAFLYPLASHDAASGEDRTATLRDILDTLRATYCGSLTCEFMHLQAPEQRQWLQLRMETTRNQWPLDPPLRRRILEKLTAAESFEHLLHARFVGHKRFSLEGGEALIPALDHLYNLAAAAGMDEAVQGMAHRGRLNFLVTILGLPMSDMVSKFEDQDPDSVEGSGDVKYHIGAEGVHRGPAGNDLALTLMPNPSHLEAVDPVVEGSARARQAVRGDQDGERVLPVLIHGDAAFAGQGVVVETLNLSQLDGYYTGGTVHIVINNQIGFTTTPSGARSSLYCTDVARTVEAPIFHVNGDDPEAVVRAIQLAFDFRMAFHRDVVVDLVCYRRHGHNESDDPSLTQPVMYRVIAAHPPVRGRYSETLAHAGVVTAAAAEAMRDECKRQLGDAAATGASFGSSAPEPPASSAPTAVAAATLAAIGERLAAVPDGFTPHPKLRAWLDKRRQAAQGASPIDWSLAEALALGSLALQQVPVRLTGQDTGRGTFSQRHAVLHDYDNGHAWVPLNHLSPGQQPVDIYDSLLSENAALGFEYGYALTHPRALVLWEAQFGDFVNGAQVVIDQFLAASLAKWNRTGGLTLLLPHGFEGQGPEHSSARMERFLQLSADDNWRIASCSTAAQYFHLLRSQGLNPRRPLVVFTPKSLLRHPEVASPLADLGAGAFQPVLADPAPPATMKRVLVCSGKVYYDLLKARRAQPEATTAILRLEQLYPWPQAELAAALAGLAAAADYRWVQEEPENMGAWNFVQNRLAAMLPPAACLTAIARAAAASPASGSLRRHQQEQAELVAQAFA